MKGISKIFIVVTQKSEKPDLIDLYLNVAILAMHIENSLSL